MLMLVPCFVTGRLHQAYVVRQCSMLAVLALPVQAVLQHGMLHMNA